ncbi:MAG TPA: efflux transporter outer membrane subunit [Phenylobacterium sp.]|nr:efflux transporter outer membrane subunit [Phenylobacterium sp.]
MPVPLPPAPGTARRAGLLAAISAIALSACASLPAAVPARTAKPAQAYETRASFAAPAADWPADRWWSAYGDAQLDRLIDEALAGSPDLATAQARLRKAQAATAQARAATLPHLSATAGVEEMKQSYHLGIPPQFVPQGYNDYGLLRLDFSWELDFWGKNRAAVAAAVSEARAADADAAEARLMLSTSIATAYADLARLYAERDVAERAVALQQQTSDLVRDRVANGLDTTGEQRQAEAQPLASQADLASLDEQIALTRNRLAALMGAGPDRGLSIARPPAAALKPFGLPATLAADLVGRRPDVAAARWRAEAAARRVKVAKASFYPNVNLAGFLGLQSLKLDELFAAGSDIGSIGPALTLPIFQGGSLRAGYRGAQADRDAAVAGYDAAVTEAFHQVADAVASERALKAELDSSRAALAASEDAYRIARLRYQGGLSNYQSVLLAEQGVLARRRAVADLDARAFALDVALVRALGGGFHA